MTATGIVIMALAAIMVNASDDEHVETASTVIFLGGAVIAFAGFVTFIWRVMP